MSGRDLTILHVEDDPDLLWIVRITFEDFGFAGSTIEAENIRKALDILNERERMQSPLSLIISDMRLPDGSGLDLIREVKSNPFWRITPVIVLSGERDPSVIDAAYALGANSYLPKDPEGSNLVKSLESFYDCWLKNAQLPGAAARDRMQEALDRATGLRARTAEFYLNLARGSGEESEMAFWLDCALAEGNLSNLLAFFRDKLHEEDFPSSTIDRVAALQTRVVNALITAEKHLKRTPSPTAELRDMWALELMEALDEKVFIETFACLFPKNPVVTEALRARAAAHFKALAVHILDHATQRENRERAAALLDRAHMLEAEG
jgi:CheY-like chemotaxis protein